MSNEYLACQNKNLLVVDDNTENRSVVIDLMFSAIPNMSVFTAKHGLQAIEILAKKPIDIILLDWEMPEMDGISFLKWLQENSQYNQIPVVMYTGIMMESESLSYALALGATDFLRKPANPIELLARLDSILRQKENEQARLRAEQALFEVQKAHLERELTLIRQELGQYLILLAQKNEFLLEIKEKCEGTEPLKPKQLAHAINQNVEQEDYWSIILNKFNTTDPQFIQKLMEAFPDISPAELRVCTLIRLKMDNKAIASLLNISNEGIKKSRYRIRKKMQLEQETDLDKFLLSI